MRHLLVKVGGFFYKINTFLIEVTNCNVCDTKNKVYFVEISYLCTVLTSKKVKNIPNILKTKLN